MSSECSQYMRINFLMIISFFIIEISIFCTSVIFDSFVRCISNRKTFVLLRDIINKFLVILLIAVVYVIWKKFDEFRSEHNKYRVIDDRLLIKCMSSKKSWILCYYASSCNSYLIRYFVIYTVYRQFLLYILYCDIFLLYILYCNIFYYTYFIL